MNQLGSNRLKKNTKDWAIFSIINNTKIENKTVIGWKFIGDKKVTIELRIHILRKFRNELVFRVADGYEKELMRLTSGSETLNFYLPVDMVLFQGRIIRNEPGKVTIHMPNMVAQVDRRSHLRLFVGEGLNCKVSFYMRRNGLSERVQAFKKSCFDISAGGLSFIASKSESRYFEEGDEIAGIELYCAGKTMILKGIIVNIMEMDPSDFNQLNYKGWKICVKYTEISEEDQKKIDKFVFQHSNFDSQAI